MSILVFLAGGLTSPKGSYIQFARVFEYYPTASPRTRIFKCVVLVRRGRL